MSPRTCHPTRQRGHVTTVPDIRLDMSPDMSTAARGVSTSDMSQRRRRSDQMSVNSAPGRVDTARGVTGRPAAEMRRSAGWRQSRGLPR